MRVILRWRSRCGGRAGLADAPRIVASLLALGTVPTSRKLFTALYSSSPAGVAASSCLLVGSFHMHLHKIDSLGSCVFVVAKFHDGWVVAE